jgi:hypothetical protein
VSLLEAYGALGVRDLGVYACAASIAWMLVVEVVAIYGTGGTVPATRHSYRSVKS